MNQHEKLECLVCGSKDIHFENKYSNPIILDIRAFVFILSTVIQRSKQIIKCSKCGYEYNVIWKNNGIKIKN